MSAPAATGVLRIDLSRFVDVHGIITVEARQHVGRVLAAAGRGVRVRVILGDAVMVDPAVERTLIDYVGRHPFEIEASSWTVLNRLVRLLRGQAVDDLDGAA